MKHFISLLLLISIVTFFSFCDKKKNTDDNDNNNNNVDTTTIPGFSILEKLPGIWNGPVTSATALGSYPEWIVDIRPFGKSRAIGKSELDVSNEIFMMFFIVQYNGKSQMALRNGGKFSGLDRVSYMILDSVAEGASESLYRFSDFKAGRQRVYTDVVFKADSLIITTYTNKYNTVNPVQLHMQWRAHLADTTSAQAAILQSDYPQKSVGSDFNNSFSNLSETVFYSYNDDPFSDYEFLNLGNLKVNVSFANNIPFNPAKKMFLLLTTQPLFNGFVFLPDNLKYRSRYLTAGAGNIEYTFQKVHSGTYNFYVLYDADGNNTFNSGDYIASNFNNTVDISGGGQEQINAVIDFQIP